MATKGIIFYFISGGLSFPKSCSDLTCKADEVCETRQEMPTCSKKPAEASTCWAMGDPHYRTFDGRFYDFMGTCTYVFAKRCAVEDVLPDFEVLSQNENRGSLRVSYVGVVTVKVYGLTITVMRTETGRVRVRCSLVIHAEAVPLLFLFKLSLKIIIIIISLPNLICNMMNMVLIALMLSPFVSTIL